MFYNYYFRPGVCTISIFVKLSFNLSCLLGAYCVSRSEPLIFSSKELLLLLFHTIRLLLYNLSIIYVFGQIAINMHFSHNGTPESLCSLAKKTVKATFPCPVSTSLNNIIFSCVLCVIIIPYPKVITKKCSFISQKLRYLKGQFALSTHSLWANILGSVNPMSWKYCGA